MPCLIHPSDCDVSAGEAANSKEKGLMESLSVDIPLDGLGLIGFPAADAISPVYTIWITLVVMYLGETDNPS